MDCLSFYNPDNDEIKPICYNRIKFAIREP